MKSFAISHYLETFSNPAGRFKTLSGIEIQYDNQGVPHHAVRSKTLDIAIYHKGKSGVLCCPLHHHEAFDLKDYVRGHYPAADPALLSVHPAEMLVFDSRDRSEWLDVLWIETPADVLTPKRANPFRKQEPCCELIFREGLAPVEENGKYGYIDRQNKVVIAHRYDWADLFDEGLALVKAGEWFGLINKSGEEIFPPVYEDIRWYSENGVVVVCDQEGRWSLRSRGNEPVGENTFDFIDEFEQDLASVRVDGKCGYINRQGEVLIPLLYDEAYSFSESGLARVVKNGIVFSIDTDGYLFD